MKSPTTTTLTVTMTALLASTGLAGCDDAAPAPRPTFIEGGRVYTVPAEDLDVHGLMREIERHADDDASVRQLAVQLDHAHRHAGLDEPDDLAAPVPLLEAGWFTLEEGEYTKELLFVGDDCGGGFDFDPEQPEPPPSLTPTNPIIFDSSPAEFTQSVTFVGEADPLPNNEVLCSSEGLVYTCDDKVNEVPGFFAAEFIGGPYDATVIQTLRRVGLLESSSGYIELQEFSNTCEGPECEAFVVALDGFVGGTLLDTLDCTVYSGWHQVLAEGE